MREKDYAAEGHQDDTSIRLTLACDSDSESDDDDLAEFNSSLFGR